MSTTVPDQLINPMNSTLAAFKIAAAIASIGPILWFIKTKQTRKKVKAEIKRNNKKYSTLTKKQKLFYETLLFNFHWTDRKAKK